MDKETDCWFTNNRIAGGNIFIHCLGDTELTKEVFSMNVKELQLEQVSKAIENHKVSKAPPIFELYAALIAMSIATIMFLVPGILSQASEIYGYMKIVAPQGGWAVMFLVSGLVSAIGMLADKGFLRVLGLLFMSIMYSVLTVVYTMVLPNFGVVLMLWLTVFTIVSIPIVKYTGLRK